MGSAATISGLDLAHHNARVTTVEAVPAIGDLPSHTRVRGVVEDEIGFEVRCPATDWNRKLLFGGEGGFAGVMGGPGSPSGIGLRRGYLEVYSDTGHRGESIDGFEAVYDGRWAWGNPRRIENWAHRSTHVVLPVARAIALAVYGEPVRRSYFMGCSGGGRQAAIVAQRYPDDFDGIVSDCPWLNLTGQMLLWLHVVRTLARQPVRPQKLPALRNAVLKIAGNEAAGFVQDPLGLTDADWPARLDTAELGLSHDEIDSVKTVYRGLPAMGLPGYLPGGEDLLWPQAIVGTADGGPGERLVLLPDNFLRYFALTPDAGIGSYDPERDAAAVRRFADLLDVKPDLTAFAAAGGKMVMIHGWNDVRISPHFTIDFRDRVVEAFGGNEDRVEEFYRLFLVAGAGHCGGGPGPNEYDGLSAIEHWVEEGRAPRELMSVARRSDGSVVATSHTPNFRWRGSSHTGSRPRRSGGSRAWGASHAF